MFEARLNAKFPAPLCVGVNPQRQSYGPPVIPPTRPATMMSNPPSGLVATDEMLVEISQKIARLEKLLRLARECDFQDAQREIQASLRDACTCDTRRSPREGPRDRAAKPVLSSRRGRRTSR